MEHQLCREDILNSIDLNKINHNEKKKRGRPKKSQQIVNMNLNKLKIDKNISAINEQDEIILHLPLTSNDINSLKNMEINLSEFDNDQNNINLNTIKKQEKKCNNILPNISNHIENKNLLEQLEQIELIENINSTNKINQINQVSQIDQLDQIENKSQQNNQNYAMNIIKKLKDENEELRKYLMEITPMYFTEIKFYPTDLKLFDKQNNQLIPKNTTVSCWWCTFQFDTLPCFIPDKLVGETFYVFGCFCSFNCAGAYNLNLNDKIWERYALLKLLYYKINSDKIASIKDIEINPAGPRELLEKFGGIMKIADYRKNSKIMGREYHKLLPPFIPLNFGFEETTNNKITKIVNFNIFNNSLKNDVIIKRNKPLNNIASKEIDQYIE